MSSDLVVDTCNHLANNQGWMIIVSINSLHSTSSKLNLHAIILRAAINIDTRIIVNNFGVFQSNLTARNFTLVNARVTKTAYFCVRILTSLSCKISY